MPEPKHRTLPIRIGNIPLSLHGEGGPLLTRAARRYASFTQNRSRGMAVFLNPRIPSSSDVRFQFQLNASTLRVATDTAHFAGVRNEYEVDSLLRILLSNLLLPRKGFLLHAATILRNGRTHVFTGRSGAGKSTVASLAPRGCALTDEISLLRSRRGQWHAYGTPFWGEFRADGQDRSAPVAGIYSLIQAKHNRLERCGAKQGLAALLGNALFFSTLPNHRSRLLDTMLGLLRDVPVYRLEFRKDSSFWELIP